MKILHVLHALSYGGAEKLVCDFVKAFEGRYEMAVACLDTLGPLQEFFQKHRIPVYCLDRRPGIDISAARKMAGLITREKFDIVHAHQYTPFFYTMLGKRLSHHKPKLIFTEHGRHQPDRVSYKRVLFNRVFLSQLDFATGVSQFSKDSLIRYEKIPAGKIQVIYNGVEDGLVDEVEVEKLKQQMGWDSRFTWFVCIGRFHPVKGQETLSRAMIEVLRERKDMRLLYAGSGPERELNEKLVQESLAGEYIRFLGDRSDANLIMRMADIVILPSLSEACSLVLLDAMRMGKAIIATRVGGNPELIRHEDSGLLVPPLDPKALAQAILKLLENITLRSRLGSRAQEIWRRSFRKETMCENYRRLYEEAVRSS